MESVASRSRKAGNIAPFWERIPRFFIYPLHPVTLVLMLGVSALASLIQPTLPGLIGGAVLLAVYLKYAYYLLDHTARGHTSPPGLTSEFFLGDYSILFKQILIFIVAGVAATIVAMAFGPIAMVVFLFLAGFAYPASVMVLATTESFFRAVHPGVLFEMIRSIGWSYLILYVFLAALNIGSERALYLVDETLSPQLQIALVTFLSMYFTYIMYNMMGYVIYQYHEPLGLEPTADTSEDREPDYLSMDQVTHFIEEENFAAAAEELKGIIRANPDDLELRLRFHRLVKLTPDTRQLTVHGEGLITRLLDANRAREANEIYLDCLAADPEFRPERKEQYLTIGKMLRAYGKPKQALALISGFHKRFPNEPLVAEVYLLAVEILVDDLRQEDKAKPILKFLGTQFRNHPLFPQIQGYQAALGVSK